MQIVRMNALFPHAPSDKTTDLLNSDEFRSRLIETVARIERWAVERLRTDKPGSKLPLLLGQKVEAIRKLYEQPTAQPGTEQTLLSLLDRAIPYLELRSSIVHSTTRKLGGNYVLYDRTDADAITPWKGRLAIHRSEFARILADAEEVCRLLTATAAPKASAPPRPRRAAAAGP
jgi:hypothetical protein